MGLEPTTARLRAARSTDWARKATNETTLTTLFYQYYNYIINQINITRHINIYIQDMTWLWHSHDLFWLCHLLFIYVLRPITTLFLYLLYFFRLLYLPFILYVLLYCPLAVSLSSPLLISCVLLVFLDILFPFIYVRKLPWLSRQSDRLLTDRSLVRSQAEAPFLLLFLLSLFFY